LSHALAALIFKWFNLIALFIFLSILKIKKSYAGLVRFKRNLGEKRIKISK